VSNALVWVNSDLRRSVENLSDANVGETGRVSINSDLGRSVKSAGRDERKCEELFPLIPI
jgi:hypothetical protein